MALAISDGRLTAVHRPQYTAPVGIRLNDDLTMDYAEIYRQQPAVRTVVDFLARNVSQLALQTFKRQGDNDRKRLRDHPVALLLDEPNEWTTGRRLIRDTVADRGIYDRALWVKSIIDGKMQLIRVPPKMWKIGGENWMRPDNIVIHGTHGDLEIPMEMCVYFHGYNPEDTRTGLSSIESLRRVLSEEFAAGQMREQSLRNGARLSGYLSRPKEAGTWSDDARRRFKAGWRGQYQGQSAVEAGGTPILEDGMTFVPVGQNAKDLQYVESRKLTREEVASAYHIPPPMVGILDHATFGNISEQHKMLYQDTLGPILSEIQDDVGLQLVKPFGDRKIYVEFNMMEKLKGSFEEQAAQLSKSVGAPHVTRNEARARQNLPAIDGGDELVVPLNVLVGGLTSPADTAPDEPANAVTVSAPFPAVKTRTLEGT